jgi:hypothetical protein
MAPLSQTNCDHLQSPDMINASKVWLARAFVRACMRARVRACVRACVRMPRVCMRARVGGRGCVCEFTLDSPTRTLRFYAHGWAITGETPRTG